MVKIWGHCNKGTCFHQRIFTINTISLSSTRYLYYPHEYLYYSHDIFIIHTNILTIHMMPLLSTWYLYYPHEYLYYPHDLFTIHTNIFTIHTIALLFTRYIYYPHDIFTIHTNILAIHTHMYIRVNREDLLMDALIKWKTKNTTQIHNSLLSFLVQALQ